MKLSETVNFDRVNLTVEGFTNLGDHTPDNQKHLRGHHALVVMFQPFRGNFVQVIGCFLSKGSASSTVLHKILLEAIALCEKAGLFIDAIVMDGAAWNRATWKLFGISRKRKRIKHPYDGRRNLWFISDWPHLVKAFRNFIVKFLKLQLIFVSF